MEKIPEDDVQKLLSTYKFKIDRDNTDGNVICLICKEILNDAYQTHCGCQYCRGCISNYLQNAKKYCQGDKKGCKDEYLVFDRNVTSNAMVNKNVSKTIVCCHNEGCKHCIELESMKEHLSVCPKQISECPYKLIGCNTNKVTKEAMLTHLNNETLPHTQLLIDLINYLRTVAETLQEDSEINKTEIEGLKKENEQLRKESQENKDLIGNLEKESKKLEKEHNANKIKIEKQEKDFNAKLEKQEKDFNAKLEKQEKDLNTKFEKQEKDSNTKLEKLENECNAKLEKMENESNAKLEKMENESIEKMKKMENECKDNKKLNGDNRLIIDRLMWAIDTINKGTITTIAVGGTILTVDRFEARKIAKEEILSPYFYSHTNGYKVQLEVRPGGFGDGSGRYLSVGIRICKGEYDNALPLWPCKYSFNIAIINQRNGSTHGNMTLSCDTAKDNCKYCYNKPINKDNDGHGHHQFMSLSSLRSTDGLIVDDCVIIKCTASAPS